jgi:4-amino-4-deoxy-L-arabinose transferase-like glycosyltransferase
MDDARRLVKLPILMFAAALLVRLTLMVALRTYHIDPAQDHFLFAHETGRLARSLASGQGFSSPFHGLTGPTAFQAPLFPYLLAGIFRLFGIYTDSSAFVILALNSLFSALTCLTVFDIGERIFGRTVANLAGWTWAFLPTAVIFSVRRVELVPLLALLLSSILLVSLHLEQSSRRRSWLFFGLLCGLCALCNPVVIAVLPFLWGWLWYRRRGQGARSAALVGICALAFLACVAPWVARNYLVFHRFIPFRANFGLELHVGNNAEAFGAPVSTLHPAYNAAELEDYRRLGEVAYMAEKKREALQYIRQHLGSFARLTLLRIAYWWSSNWQIRGTGRGAEWAAAGIWFGFALENFLALLGLILALRSGKKEAMPFAMLLIFYPLLYYVVFYQLRYRHPLEPALVLLGVYALQRIFSREPAEAPASAGAARTAG